MIGPFTNANPFGNVGFSGNQNTNTGGAANTRLADFGTFAGNVAAPVANLANPNANTNNAAGTQMPARVGGTNVQFAPAQEPGRIGRTMGEVHTLE